MTNGGAVLFIFMLIFLISLSIHSCTTRELDELTKNITVIETVVDEDYIIVSNEPKIYRLKFVKDFPKIQKGKTYRMYIILNNTKSPQIYDVGPEVTEGIK